MARSDCLTEIGILFVNTDGRTRLVFQHVIVFVIDLYRGPGLIVIVGFTPALGFQTKINVLEVACFIADRGLAGIFMELVIAPGLVCAGKVSLVFVDVQ